MKLLLPISMLVVAVLFTGVARALEGTTTVDLQTQSVRLDFTDLPPYQQIRLEGVMALFWCNCLDLDNPSSIGSTGFTVNGTNLEMQYEGPTPPSTNFITYHYLDGYDLSGFESLDWILVSEEGGDELPVPGDRPILVPLPEPTASLLHFVGLSTVCLLTRSRRLLLQ